MNEFWQAVAMLACGILAAQCLFLGIRVMQQPPYERRKHLWTGLAIDRRKNEWKARP